MQKDFEVHNINNEFYPDLMTQLEGGSKLLQMKTRFQTLVGIQRHRKEEMIKEKLPAEAASLAESFFYSWSQQGGLIEGIGYHGAMCLARLWGNCTADIVDYSYDPVKRETVLYASFIDFETNFNITRPYKMNDQFPIYGKHNEFRKDDMRLQIGASKALRNVILAGIPVWVQELGLKSAKQGIRKQIDAYIEKNGIAKAIEMLVSSLAKKGVNEDAIKEKFNVNKLSDLVVKDLINMRADISSIENGNANVEELYNIESKNQKDIKDRLEKKAEKVKEKKQSKPPEKKDDKKQENNDKKDDKKSNEKQDFYEAWLNTNSKERYSKLEELKQKTEFDFEEWKKANFERLTSQKVKLPIQSFIELPAVFQVEILWILTQKIKLEKAQNENSPGKDKQ